METILLTALEKNNIKQKIIEEHINVVYKNDKEDMINENEFNKRVFILSRIFRYILNACILVIKIASEILKNNWLNIKLNYVSLILQSAERGITIDDNLIHAINEKNIIKINIISSLLSEYNNEPIEQQTHINISKRTTHHEAQYYIDRLKILDEIVKFNKKVMKYISRLQIVIYTISPTLTLSSVLFELSYLNYIAIVFDFINMAISLYIEFMLSKKIYGNNDEIIKILKYFEIFKNNIEMVV